VPSLSTSSARSVAKKLSETTLSQQSTASSRVWRLKLDNNDAERQLRRVAVGRNDWLFAGSDDSAVRACVLYSLVAACTPRMEHDASRYVVTASRGPRV
jgi:hypothetical protein